MLVKGATSDENELNGLCDHLNCFVGIDTCTLLWYRNRVIRNTVVEWMQVFVNNNFQEIVPVVRVFTLMDINVNNSACTKTYITKIIPFW